MKCLSKIILWFLCLGLPLAAGAADQAPQVVVSLKPIHSLVASVMAGVGKPTLLIEGGASPHDYSLRPSDVRAINAAQVVFWVGEEMESFLVKPVANAQTRSVELMQAPGMELLALREGGIWEAHDHAEHEHGEHEHGEHEHGEHGENDKHSEHGEHDEHSEHGEHDEHSHGEHEKHDDDHGKSAHAHGDHDPHIWLDPHNGEAIIQQISAVLSEIDPDNAAVYEKNAKAAMARLKQLDQTLKAQLAPVKDKPYIVFHDAYQYFETHYGLAAAGSITLDPEQRPGARRIQAIRKRVTNDEIVCIFSEPQFEPALVQTLIAGTDVKSGVLDPLGAELAAGPDAYFQLLTNLTDSLRACLGA